MALQAGGFGAFRGARALLKRIPELGVLLRAADRDRTGMISLEGCQEQGAEQEK
jgi:hypothetical protein